MPAGPLTAGTQVAQTILCLDNKKSVRATLQRSRHSRPPYSHSSGRRQSPADHRTLKPTEGIDSSPPQPTTISTTATVSRPPYTNLVEGGGYAKPAACRPPGRRMRRTNGCAVSRTPFSTKRLALIHLNLRRSQQLLLSADHRILIWWRGADSNHRSFRVRFTV